MKYGHCHYQTTYKHFYTLLKEHSKQNKKLMCMTRGCKLVRLTLITFTSFVSPSSSYNNKQQQNLTFLFVFIFFFLLSSLSLSLCLLQQAEPQKSLKCKQHLLVDFLILPLQWEPAPQSLQNQTHLPQERTSRMTILPLLNHPNPLLLLSLQPPLSSPSTPQALPTPTNPRLLQLLSGFSGDPFLLLLPPSTSGLC